jgi:hypothetical protein
VTHDVFTLRGLSCAQRSCHLRVESGTGTPPPNPVPLKFSPIDKVKSYYLQHRRDQVHTFEGHVQDPESINRTNFLEYLRGSDKPQSRPTPRLFSGDCFSSNGFVNLANSIAESMGETGEYYLLRIYIFFDDTWFFTWFSER